MDIRALRYFQAVAEYGSYSRGAEFLRISQPAVSRQIRQLEGELGNRLFDRHGHGVTLTDAGRTLLERSQAILRQLEQVQAELRAGSAGPSGMITFAVPPGAGHYLVPALAERFARDCPNVFVKVVGGFSGYIHDWLVRGQVDLACVHDPLPQRGFEVTPLVREQVYVVGLPDRFPIRRDHVRTDDLPRFPLILPSRPNASRRLLDSWIAARNLSLQVMMEVDDPSIIRALLRRGLGFSLLSRGAIENEVRHGELRALPFRPAAYWRLALMRPVHGPRAEVLDRFGDAIRAVARELTASGAWPGESIDIDSSVAA